MSPLQQLPGEQELMEGIHQLRQLCWSVAGVERSGHCLSAALPIVRRQRSELERHPAWRQVQELKPGQSLTVPAREEGRLRLLQELHHRLVLAELLVGAALFREESRGGHFRTDAPASQPFWRRHSLQRRGQAMTTRAVADGPAARGDVSP